ncbi:hypothetical protein M3Y98_00123700 [Aphelenchoides besseyi]|nr:hypothetical protein M3Y98_00123700 [Aphelenchoides besseyi]
MVKLVGQQLNTDVRSITQQLLSACYQQTLNDFYNCGVFISEYARQIIVNDKIDQSITSWTADEERKQMREILNDIMLKKRAKYDDPSLQQDAQHPSCEIDDDVVELPAASTKPSAAGTSTPPETLSRIPLKKQKNGKDKKTLGNLAFKAINKVADYLVKKRHEKQAAKTVEEETNEKSVTKKGCITIINAERQFKKTPTEIELSKQTPDIIVFITVENLAAII